MAKPLTKAQLKALRIAARRERSAICPIIGVHGAAEQRVIDALDARGFITWDGWVPRINDAGRAAVAEAEDHHS